MSGTILSLLMLAGFALMAGGIYLFIKRPGDRFRAILMVVAGIVMFGNVAISLQPMPKVVFEPTTTKPETMQAEN